MILRRDGSKVKKSIRVVAASLTLVVSLLGGSMMAFAASAQVPQAQAEKSNGAIQTSGFVDNINNPPQNSTEAIAPKVQTAPTTQSCNNRKLDSNN